MLTPLFSGLLWYPSFSLLFFFGLFSDSLEGSPPPPHCLSLKCYNFPVFVLCFTLSLSTHPLGLPHYPSWFQKSSKWWWLPNSYSLPRDITQSQTQVSNTLTQIASWTSQRHHKLGTLKSRLIIPPSKPACFHILSLMKWHHSSSSLSQTLLSPFTHLSFSPFISNHLQSSSYRLITSVSLCSLFSSLHPWSYYSNLCHYYLVTIPASEILPPPFLLLPVYSLHCNQDGLFVIQIWLLASLTKIFFLVSHGLQK